MNKVLTGCGEDSVAGSTAALPQDSVHPRGGSQPSVTAVAGEPHPLQASTCTRHASGAETHM